MKHWIILRGVGINGKSTIIESLQKEFEDLVWVKPPTREFYELKEANSPAKLLDIETQLELVEFYFNRFSTSIMNAPENSVIISERSMLDLYAHYSLLHPELSPESPELERLKSTVLNLQLVLEGLIQTTQVYPMINLDSIKVKTYIKSLPKTDLHRSYYKSRGYYFILQDRYWMAMNELGISTPEESDLMKSLDDSAGNTLMLIRNELCQIIK